MDIIVLRAEKAFEELMARDFLRVIESGKADGARLYRFQKQAGMENNNRDERILLHQAQDYKTKEEILQRAAAKYMLSDQVRWSIENSMMQNRISGGLHFTAELPRYLFVLSEQNRIWILPVFMKITESGLHDILN